MLELGDTSAGSVVDPGEPERYGLSPGSPGGRSMKPEAPGPGCNCSPDLVVTSGSFGPVGSVFTLVPFRFSPAASARTPYAPYSEFAPGAVDPAAAKVGASAGAEAVVTSPAAGTLLKLLPTVK